MLKWKDYDKALSKYKKVVDRCLTEVRAWWRLTRCLSEDFSKDKIEKYEYEEIQYYAEKVFKTTENQTLTIIRPIWDEYTARVFRYINEEETRIRIEYEKRIQIERERQNNNQSHSNLKNSNSSVKNTSIDKSYSQQTVKIIIVLGKLLLYN